MPDIIFADLPGPVPAATDPTPTNRADLMNETRALILELGAVWLCAHGPMKYGKAKLSDVTDAELAAIHAKAKAAVAA
jgi:hypothetical protein